MSEDIQHLNRLHTGKYKADKLLTAIANHDSFLPVDYLLKNR